MDVQSKLSDADKLSKAREYKEKGNAYHKEGKFMKAAGSYHRAILYLKGLSTNCPDVLGGMIAASGGDTYQSTMPKMTPDMMDESRILTCDCYNNLAACMLKEPQPKYERIIEHCNSALEASPHNVKALFRKGTSLYALGDYEGALSTLEKAPPDLSIKKYIDLCKAGIKRQDRELAEKFKGMFKS